jgi:hypothetical protein
MSAIRSGTSLKITTLFLNCTVPARTRDPKKGRISAALLVELPGIESGTRTPLTSENLDVQYAKAREMTGGDLQIRGVC